MIDRGLLMDVDLAFLAMRAGSIVLP
jgi:hypothetical protein